MKDERKVIVLGGSASGKTTILRHICSKTVETIAMEYGNTIFDGVKIHFFGVPSNERFGFMNDVLSKRIDGALILIDENGLNNAELETASAIKENSLPYIIIASQDPEYPINDSNEISILHANNLDNENIYKGMKMLLDVMNTKEHDKVTAYGA